MYRALFASLYYRLFRIGELIKGDHHVKACDVHVAKKKGKMVFFHRPSKTHSLESRPQKVKLEQTANGFVGHFCPFTLTADYIAICGD